jgi:cytochrome oxidase assembly protein ShyY1
MLAMMVRPRWIGALLLSILIAGVFAWLGHWQLQRAVQDNVSTESYTEVVRPIANITTPGHELTQRAAGQMVRTSGTFVSSDFLVLGDRVNNGTTGWWVIGDLKTDAGRLAVGVGWAPTEAKARASAAALSRAWTADPASVTLAGRLSVADEPVDPDPGADLNEPTAMAPAALVNLWETGDTPVYAGYLVAAKPAVARASGLSTIVSPAPIPDSQVNWLNIFYAVEWIVFAGAAFFFWFRLVKDAVLREEEDLLDAEEAARVAARDGVSATGT